MTIKGLSYKGATGSQAFRLTTFCTSNDKQEAQDVIGDLVSVSAKISDDKTGHC
jgi:hypothetical protein